MSKDKHYFKENLNFILGKIYLRPLITAIRTFLILEFNFGHFLSSLKWQSVNCKNQPIPWFSYPAIEFLNHLDLRKRKIFEYGSGNSTLYWIKKCAFVFSVESNNKWFNTINEKINSKKAKIILETKRNKYINSIDIQTTPYDIIVIDGIERYKCTKKAVTKLSKSGFIILDNSDWFPKTCTWLRKKKFIQIDFSGFGPINPYTSQTSIFFLNTIDFKYKKNISITGGINNKDD